MVTSTDGRILPSRWTQSPDGTRADWTAAYAAIHEGVGRRGLDRWPRHHGGNEPCGAACARCASEPPRPHHFARKDAKAYAVALDPAARLHFDRADIDGDPIVVLLGRTTPAAHLAELVAGGISYVVSERDEIELVALLETLGRALSIKRMALEAGGEINGALFAAGVVDELSLLIAPTLDGRTGSRALVEIEGEGLAGKVELSLLSCERLDHGLAHLRYTVRTV